MTLPKLAVPNSGWGGRGYKNPVTKDKRVVPSITTVLKAEAKPALAQWAADQTAGFAVANAHLLLSRSEEWGFKMLRWYHRRDPKDIEPGMDLNSFHLGVKDDAAEMGTWAHEWVQADLVEELEYPDVEAAHESHWEMVAEWEKFKAENDVEPHFTEHTVWHDELGYAGTLDGVWKINGKHCLMDIKTSRGLYTSTWMQLAALLNAPEMFVPKDEDNYMALRDWQAPVEEVGVLHLRPRDWDSQGREMAPFCRWVEAQDLDLHFEGFKGLLQYGEAQRAVRLAEREREKNGN